MLEFAISREMSDNPWQLLPTSRVIRHFFAGPLRCRLIRVALYKWFYLFNFKAKEKLLTYEKLITEKALSKGMAWKLVTSGLEFVHLHAAYLRDGIKNVLSEKCNGTVRVTKCSKVIEKIVSWFDKNVSSSNEE